MGRLKAFAACLAFLAGFGVAEAQAQKSAPPGQFDYYLLSLSWSPEYCAGKVGKANTEQCGTTRRYGFVVHGLWPQYDRGGYPESCQRTGAVPKAIVDRMMPIMPSSQLINHQWEKHGTCSGLGMDTYFADIQKLYRQIRIPQLLQAPDLPVSLPADDLEELLASDNPGLADARMAVTCSGQYVSEIRICLDKNLKPRDCGRNVRDTCGKGWVVLRPLR